MIIFAQLFLSFLKMGLLGFGGGYAIIAMIQSDVVTKYHWLTLNEFTDIIAISQMTPGPIGINSATYVGYTAIVNAGYDDWVGVIGSIVATVALVLPSFVLMLAVSKLIMHYWEHKYVKSIFSLLRPIVVGMIAAASLILFFQPGELKLSQETFGVSVWQNVCTMIIFIFTFVSTYIYKTSPIRLLMMASIAGFILFY